MGMCLYSSPRPSWRLMTCWASCMKGRLGLSASRVSLETFFTVFTVSAPPSFTLTVRLPASSMVMRLSINFWGRQRPERIPHTTAPMAASSTTTRTPTTLAMMMRLLFVSLASPAAESGAATTARGRVRAMFSSWAHSVAKSQVEKPMPRLLGLGRKVWKWATTTYSPGGRESCDWKVICPASRATTRPLGAAALPPGPSLGGTGPHCRPSPTAQMARKASAKSPEPSAASGCGSRLTRLLSAAMA
mmetsp:Transcript_9470/g.27042  ORF Transcript_9470/g.27042 Transcript_9470/m.27042 type:complete len:246 (+) Transcript_9470:1735-2472(+)